MRIAVTGGSGFIGSAAVRYADKLGHTGFPLDLHGGFNVLSWADCDRELSEVDAVIHLAGMLGTAELFDAAREAVNVNVHGTLNVLDACKRYGLPYVGITMPPVFPSVYTATKVCADRLASAYHHAYGFPVSRVCAFNAFGPGQKHGPGHPQKIIPTFATCAWAGQPIPIWGDGSQTVDLVSATDVGRMLVDALLLGGHDDVYDAGTGVAMTVNQVAERVTSYVARVTGKPPVPHEYLPMRKGELPTKIVATGEGWQRLGWRPALITMELHEAIDFYRPGAQQ